MDFGGRYVLGAPRAQVWAALNDTGVLQRTIPGCRRIEWTGPDSLEIEIEANLGLMKPVFTGDLSLTNVSPAESYRLRGRGRGGLLALAEAGADITLADAGPDRTLLAFTATGGASGQIMKLGKALIGNSAQKLIDGFFVRFGEAMGASVEPLPADGTV